MLSEKTKNRLSTGLWIGFVGGMFLAVGILITVSYARNSFARKYTIHLADTLVNVDVYAERDDLKVQLNDKNIRALAIMGSSGSIYFERKSSEYSGREIHFTAIEKDTDVRRYITVREMTDGRTVVTVENENDTMTATLSNTRYANFVRIMAVNSAYGLNPEVDEIP